MGSFSAELRVAGFVFPVLHARYETSQATDARGRVVEKVRRHPVELLLDVPDHNFLEGWAADAHKRLAAQVVFRNAATGSALETLELAAAYCVHYSEAFHGGDHHTGAYTCQVVLSDPDGWALQPGGPTAGARTASPATLVAPAPVPVEVLPGAPWPLLGALPALAVAAAVAVLLPANDLAAPGYDAEKNFGRRARNLARLAHLETERAHRPLTADEEAELLDLLARVKGVRLQRLSDADYNKEWDDKRLPGMAHLDLNATVAHVEYRDFSVPRKKGIGGAHNAAEWSKYKPDYVEISRVPHPTVPGVEQIEYQIYALDNKGKASGQLVAKVYDKTVYNPKIWPRPRLERALREGLQDAYQANGGALPSGYWEGTTSEGYGICGYNRNNQIDTFFFK